MCGHQLSETANGQVISLPGGVHAIEFAGFRISLTRERFEDFRAFVAELRPNLQHSECGWRKDVYVSLSQDSPLQIGLEMSELLELRDLLDLAAVAVELAEMLA